MEIQKAEKMFKAGEVIMTQGDEGSCAYFIQEGRVGIVVEKSDGQLLHMGTRGPGSIIGEMAIVDNQPRSATIRSLENCTLLEITKDDFARSVRGANPIVRLIAQVILMRYRDILRRSQTLLSDSPDTPSPEDLEREYAEQINVVEAIKMANEFKVAIASNQLILNYQPIVSMRTGRILGFEALMRWHHPERGLIPPDVFIPMAEDSGLIIEASRWAVRNVCQMLKQLDQSRPDLRDIYVSVNFSATDFDEDSFLTSLYEILAENGTSASRIHIEITERLLLKQPKNVKETLDQCRDRGMGIIIDDFGTGYSSLSYLHQYPIDTLKIDQSFIRKMRHDTMVMGLVKSILSLSENMNIKIIAEGVEDIEEARLLKELNCDMAQGYFFSRPVAEEQLAGLLIERNPQAS
ncbi:MAG: EAL domain-containing protein [Gammaproteobacteria bacterium]|nr:EAL domain-containing protein [Gammaproteobacteria bacterium]MDP2140915.1 EAL domain-containing protein [Gammaproteobacteria bacterium]MDP2349341.1 EAL domain-containing protein [Gammaproteobacteria bacterium]